jgi:hypothetical protein
LIQKLPLATSQRQWLTTMAQELKLPQPSVILFSRSLLEQSYEQWVSRRAADSGQAGEPSDRHVFAQVRAALFPHGPEPDPSA